MRIHVYKKHQNKIKEVGEAIDRSSQFIVNAIVDDIFTRENPVKYLEKLMLKNLRKLNIK